MGLLLLMGDSGFRGALDTLTTGLESAWSVGRRLRSAYTGAIIRVRRSSDNVEQDFSGSGASGAVDASAVAAFCGAGDGFLATIYDQSGNARNYTQSSTTLQPRVVASGVAETMNGYLSARFIAASSLGMSVASSTALYNFLHNGTSSTLYFVCSANDTAAFKTITRNATGTGPGIMWFITTTEGAYLQVDNGTATASVLHNTGSEFTGAQLFTNLIDADNGTAGLRSTMWKNGTQLTLTPNTNTAAVSSSNAPGNFTLGIQASGGNGFDGLISEFVVWSTDRSANRTTWEVNAKAFWGTP